MRIDEAPQQPPPPGVACRWAGPAAASLVTAQLRRGRRRRWVYVAAGDRTCTVGAAVVDVGLLGLGTAFAFATTPAGMVRWDPGPGRAGRVGGLSGAATVARGGGRVALSRTRLRVDVPVEGGRLRADVALGPGSPVSLLTPTPDGGWNATTKDAGVPAHGSVATPTLDHELDGGAWTDATDGRQDAHTTWRWAAGAGAAVTGGMRVGVQASTGMNGSGPGEDTLWWDGRPVPLDVSVLAPVDPARPDGRWRLAGPTWSLTLEPSGVRAAREGIGPLRSAYSQPVGTWRGTLPGPDGEPVAVWLAGVAEEHEAHW